MNDAATETCDGADPARSLPARRRPHTFVERFLFRPIGLLWLGLLFTMALPVMVVMTLLYYLTRPFASQRRAGRQRRNGGEELQGPAS